MSDEKEKSGGSWGKEPVDFEQHIQVKQQLDHERERSQRFEAQLVDLQKKVEAFNGVDLDKLRADSEALQHLQRDNAIGNREQIDSLINEAVSTVRTEAATTIDALKEQISARDKQLHELQVVDAAMNKIGGLFNDDMQPFIKQTLRDNITKTDSGDLVVIDSDGKVKYNDDQKPMGINDFAKELVSKYPSMARPTVKSGAMPNGTVQVGGAELTPERYSQMSKEERAQLPPVKRKELAAKLFKV